MNYRLIIQPNGGDPVRLPAMREHYTLADGRAAVQVALEQAVTAGWDVQVLSRDAFVATCGDVQYWVRVEPIREYVWEYDHAV